MAKPGIPFPFMEGTTIFFRWADAKAAAERVTGERSAAPGALIQALAQLDLNAVEIGLQHGLKNIGDLSPVTRDFGSEIWPVDEVSDLLMQAIEALFFGKKAGGEDPAIADNLAFAEARSIEDSPTKQIFASMHASKVADAKEVELQGGSDET